MTVVDTLWSNAKYPTGMRRVCTQREEEGGGRHLGGVAYLRIVDVHGGADPLGQIQLRRLLSLPRRQSPPAGKQLPLQHHRLVIHHLPTCAFSVREGTPKHHKESQRGDGRRAHLRHDHQRGRRIGQVARPVLVPARRPVPPAQITCSPANRVHKHGDAPGVCPLPVPRHACIYAWKTGPARSNLRPLTALHTVGRSTCGEKGG